MDDKGNLYWEDEFGKLFNEKNQEVKTRPTSLLQLDTSDYEKIKDMSRAERRAWLRKNRSLTNNKT